MVKDGSLAAAVLDRGSRMAPVPASLIEACSLPEIGGRLAYLSVRLDGEIHRPFRLDGSIVVLRPDVAADLASAAMVLREAIELSVLGNGRIGWPDRIVAHAIALGYSQTALRRRAGGRTPSSELIAPVVTVEGDTDHAIEAATRIAQFLGVRDDAPSRCPDDAIQAAARALPLATPTQVLLASGGDDRQRVDWDRGVNPYGIAPRPTPWITSFGSCTASSPTDRAFEAATHLKYRLIEAAFADQLDRAIEGETELVRSTLLAALGVDADSGVEVVLTPSGTDAELVALAVSLAAGGPVRSLVVGPTEIGRGSVPAAAGRHFSARRPSGRVASEGDPVDGIDLANVVPVEIPIRRADGTMLPPQSVEDHIDAEITAASDRILLHVVEGSKTGIRLPRSSAVAGWQEREGLRLDVVVDAAQMRINQQTVVSHLAHERMIFVTGSKFFGGPPFSGALLLPPRLADRVRSAAGVPHGLSDYLTKSDVPPTLSPLRTAARSGTNFGLLARWSAALAEMRSFHNASWEIRDEVLRVLAAGLRHLLVGSPQLEIVESPYSRIPAQDRRGLDDLPTIFTFLVRDPHGRYLDLEQAKRVHELLGRDLKDEPELSSRVPPIATRAYHFGQPVKIARDGDRWIAALRIAIGAPAISRIVFDHTRGETWTDRVDRELADVADALSKLELILQRIDVTRDR